MFSIGDGTKFWLYTKPTDMRKNFNMLSGRDDESLPANELIAVICEAMGKKAHIWRLPKGLMNGIAKLGGWLHLPLNPLRMQKLTENYVVSNAKIKAALGITQMPIRAKDGLMETIKSFGE